MKQKVIKTIVASVFLFAVTDSIASGVVRKKIDKIPQKQYVVRDAYVTSKIPDAEWDKLVVKEVVEPVAAAPKKVKVEKAAQAPVQQPTLAQPTAQPQVQQPQVVYVVNNYYYGQPQPQAASQPVPVPVKPTGTTKVVPVYYPDPKFFQPEIKKPEKVSSNDPILGLLKMLGKA